MPAFYGKSGVATFSSALLLPTPPLPCRACAPTHRRPSGSTRSTCSTAHQRHRRRNDQLPGRIMRGARLASVNAHSFGATAVV